MINGTKDSPVLIKSDDNSAGGFTVLQAGGLSTIKHCVFEGFSSLHRGGWQLTGGVTFYESPVDISYTEFTKSQSEDALNIIRTSFNLVHCKFSQSMRDAFDTDFCEGRVSDVSFREISNDALDFSGSTVYVDSCRISDTFDKGISCGEKSTIYISNSTIKDADIGIAAKDLSRVEVTNVVLTNTKYGVVAFRKKTEYGPAFISTDSLQFSNVKIFHLIEKGSVFYLNGDSIAGQAKNVADIFYPFEN